VVNCQRPRGCLANMTRGQIKIVQHPYASMSTALAVAQPRRISLNLEYPPLQSRSILQFRRSSVRQDWSSVGLASGGTYKPVMPRLGAGSATSATHPTCYLAESSTEILVRQINAAAPAKRQTHCEWLSASRRRCRTSHRHVVPA